MNYIIVLDTTQIQFDFNDVHRFITTSTEISDWWHHLPSTYIVTTHLTAKQMADSFVSNYPGLRHFITRVELSEYNGVLQDKAWEWLKNKTRMIFGLQPTPIAKSVSINDLVRRIVQNNGGTSFSSPDTMNARELAQSLKSGK